MNIGRSNGRSARLAQLNWNTQRSIKRDSGRLGRRAFH